MTADPRQQALHAMAEAEASEDFNHLARAAAMLAPFPDLARYRARAEWMLSRYSRDPAVMEAAGATYVAAEPNAQRQVSCELTRIHLDQNNQQLARRHLANYPLPKGWRATIAKRQDVRWNAETPQTIRTERNGILLAGGRDWFTMAGDGTVNVDDLVNAGPEGGQYLICMTMNGLAAVAHPRRVDDLGRSPHILIGSNGNYYHWLFDYLPRVAQTLAQPNLQDLPLIVGETLAPFERDTLALLGIAPSRLHPIPSGSAWRFGRLHIPSIGAMHQQPHPETIAWLRATFLANPTPTRSRRLWISRRDATARRIVNEDEVLAVLAPLGFECVEMSALSVRDQAQLFAEAETVVGPHGAAFSNIVFCQTGTRVLEVMPGRHGQLGFFPDLATVCRLRHGRINAQAVPSAERLMQDWDMRAAPDAILAAIQASS